MLANRKFPKKKRGFLQRLRNDNKGNTIVIMGATLFPLLGIIGGGVDVARGYMARAKLQHACDAGSLAARKALKEVSISTDAAAQNTGRKFFNYNFPNGTLGITTTNGTFSYSSGSTPGLVQASATVQLPTTIMRVFNFTEMDIDVSCSSDLDIGNVDVMLALDVTNSMNQRGSEGVRRIDSLKSAVEDFYTTLGPGGGPGNNRIRYGVVPYASTANTGRIIYDLDSSYIIGADDALPGTGTYRTRQASGSGFNYGAFNLNVRAYAKSIDPANPTTSAGSIAFDSAPERWEGCLEERQTNSNIVPGTSTIPSNSLDLEIDLIPNSPESRWLPFWSNVVFDTDKRRYFALRDNGTVNAGLGACVQPSRKLESYAVWSDGTTNDLQSYIDGLRLGGRTNHTIGLIWAARLLSGTGLFGAENTTAPNGRPIDRHIVFMTDGEMFIAPTDYDSYGYHRYDGRTARAGASRRELIANQVARFRLMCERVRAQGMTIWVIEFSNLDTPNPDMSQCASAPENAQLASNKSELEQAFVNIASQIGGLRLTE